MNNYNCISEKRVKKTVCKILSSVKAYMFNIVRYKQLVMAVPVLTTRKGYHEDQVS